MESIPFAIPCPDGYYLRGRLHPPAGEPAPAVLIVHGFKGFMDWGYFPYLADRLAEAGLAACRFNLSGSGVQADSDFTSEPERFEHNRYSRDLADIALVLDALAAGEIPGAATRPGPVGLLGHSRGGGMAILAAAERPERVASLVTWSAISTVQRYGENTKRHWREQGWLRVENARTGEVFRMRTDLLEDIETNAERLDILAAAARAQAPALLAHGREDEAVPLVEAERLAAAFGGRGRLLVVERTGHTFGARHPFADVIPEPLERVIEASIEHLREALLRE